VKPAPFEYHDPDHIDAVLDLLAQLGDEAKVLAGGQSLVPLMNFRLARPAHLIDLNRVAQLSYVRNVAGELVIGAMTRQRSLERSPLAVEWPVIADALQYVGHTPIRVASAYRSSWSRRPRVLTHSTRVGWITWLATIRPSCGLIRPER
jgi:carbon-monoxide dehydrogenase medium subunit